MKSSVVKRSIVIDGKKTSICLEEPFWCGFKEIAQEGGLTLSELVSRIKAEKGEVGNFSSAIRVYILGHFRERLPEGERARDSKVHPIEHTLSPQDRASRPAA